MKTFEQMPYDLDAQSDESIFVDNPDPRCPCVLLLDKSASMTGDPIRQLNQGLRTFKTALVSDPLAARRVEVAVVSFGPVTADVEFMTAETFEPPVLAPEADTPMGHAIVTALDMISRRKATYKQHGIAYYRPWIFLITDGAPTDNWREAAKKIREEEAAKRVAFFAVGTADADFDTLAQLGMREPLRLDGLKFGDLFKWLSASLTAVSRSQPGTQVALPPPGWANV